MQFVLLVDIVVVLSVLHLKVNHKYLLVKMQKFIYLTILSLEIMIIQIHSL